mgnify:CR=1 FL=1
MSRDGKWDTINAADLVPGDVVEIAGGQVVPADVVLIDGEYLSCDQAALTGESLPVSKKIGDKAYSGSIAKQGSMTGVVTATGSNTFFGRTAKLVGSAGAVSHSQRAVTQVGDFLLLLALVLAAILVGVQGYRLVLADDWSWSEFGSVAQYVLVLLIASIPVALPAVMSVTMAIGAYALAPESDRFPVVRNRGTRRRRHSLQRQNRHADDESAHGPIRHPIRIGQGRRRAARCRSRYPEKQSGCDRRRHPESD